MENNEQFINEVNQNIDSLAKDLDVQALSRIWVREIAQYKYAYNFSFLGRPIIQFPQDMVAIQELIWQIKPDLIIETGIAHGGSLIMSAAMLSLLDYCEAMNNGEQILDLKKSHRKVLGIDIDIRQHNRMAIEKHPMSNKIEMIQGSSIAPEVIQKVKQFIEKFDRVMVLLDSLHTHEHVLGELQAYAPLVTKGSYCVVSDTLIEDMPKDSFNDRPWDIGNNPKTAVFEYLKNHPEFEIDSRMDHKLLISSAPSGYLKRIN